MAAGSDELLGEQVAAGEFSSALDTAGKIGDPAKRNQWLVRIAGAQARSGDRSASYNTLANVNDDSGPQRRPSRKTPLATRGAFSPTFKS